MMYQQQNKEMQQTSSPLQSQSSCESSTERMNRAQANHLQLNPYPDFGNNFFIQDYTQDEEELNNQNKTINNKNKKSTAVSQSQQQQQPLQLQQQHSQQPERRIKAAVSLLVDNDEDEIEQQIQDSAMLKISSNAPPPVPNPSQVDGRRQIKDISSFFKNNNIFLDEDFTIKCTTSQILSRKDEFDECLNTSQRKNNGQSSQIQSTQNADSFQNSPPIGRNKDKNDKSPTKMNGDYFGKQIISEYICSDKDATIQQSNNQFIIPVLTTSLTLAAAPVAPAGNTAPFQYTNSIYSNMSSDQQCSQNQIQSQKITSQTLKHNPTHDSLNSFSSNQLSSVDNSKGSSNQSIKQLETNVKEEEIKNKIGLESLSILRSEVNQFLGLLQNYNNEIMNSPKHQQLIQQKLLSSEDKDTFKLENSSEPIEKNKIQVQDGCSSQQQQLSQQQAFVKQKNSASNWKEEYSQKLGEFLDDHKDMTEFCFKLDNDSFQAVTSEKQNYAEQEIQSQEKQRDIQDQLIRSKLSMNNNDDINYSQKQNYKEGGNGYSYESCDDQDQMQKHYSYLNNYYQDVQSPSGYNDYERDIASNQDNTILSSSSQQNSYRGGSGGQTKKMYNNANYANLSIIFSESEKSSPQLKQSESSQSQDSSSMLVDSNKDVIEYDMQNQNRIGEVSSAVAALGIKKMQMFGENLLMKTNITQVNQTTALAKSQTLVNQTAAPTGEKNKIFNLDIKNFDGIAEELFKHSDYLQQQINQAQTIAQISRSTPLEKQRSIMSNDSCNTSINAELAKKSDSNESLVYLREAFSICMSDLKSSLSFEVYNSVEQKLKSVQQAYHSHIQLEIERTQILEKKNENLNKSNDMIVQALQATKEEIKQLIQNYQLLSEDHNELIEQNSQLVSKEKKYLGSLEKIDKERQHLKYLILVANEKYEKIDDKCTHLIKKNSTLNEQISNMQNQFSNINQILREVIINLQENKDSETHIVLQQILKETNDMMNKKENESQFSKYSHYSPNASHSTKQIASKENSLGRVQKTRSSSPNREGISPPSKQGTLNHASSSYLNSSFKSKDSKGTNSQQQGVGRVFSNISLNQAANINNTKRNSGNSTSQTKINKNPQVQVSNNTSLNQSLGNIKQKENINRQKTPPKVLQKHGLPSRSKEDQRKIEETYRQIFLKQLKQSKIKEINNNIYNLLSNNNNTKQQQQSQQLIEKQF